MFVYSINGRLMEDGQYNPAIVQILGSVAIFSIVLMLLFSFSKMAQNIICALFTMIFVVIFMHQFGVFDITNYIEFKNLPKESYTFQYLDEKGKAIMIFSTNDNEKADKLLSDGKNKSVKPSSIYRI